MTSCSSPPCDLSFPQGLTCPGPDRSLVALLPTIGHHHHPVQSSRSETLERALLSAGLVSSSLLQRVVTFKQEDLVTLELSLWWEPVERQTGGGVGFDGQISDGCRTWQKGTGRRHSLTITLCCFVGKTSDLRESPGFSHIV